jgi:hypothetical protein
MTQDKPLPRQPSAPGEVVGSETEMAEQIAELEDRVSQLEGGTSIRSRGNSLMRAVMPADAQKHFRNAGREQLLGIRAIVDHWIARIDRLEDDPATAERQTIEIR